MRALTPLEARVLGVLVEKQATVPDTYPLSLNSLVAGVNQKTARDPVINASESDVLAAVDGLKSLSLAFETSGSRVSRYEHNMTRGMAIAGQATALLAVLMLRGPQTAAELRANCERLHRFADISSVEGFLNELADRFPPRAVLLPRAPGAREARWAHMLCGEVQMTAERPAPGGSDDERITVGELVALKAELARQGEVLSRQAGELAALRALVQRMATELGMEATPPAA